MKSRAADELLDAVGRRMRQQRLGDAARFAAWTAVAISATAILLHLVVRPVGLVALLAPILVVCGGALLQAFAIPVTGADRADWADRNLDGRSAYSTYLECTTRSRSTDPAALGRLVDWLDDMTPRSRSRLDAIAFDAGSLKPAVAGAVAVALAIVVLLVPSPARITGGARAQIAADRPLQAAGPSMQSADAHEDAGAAPAAAATGPAAAKRDGAGRTPVAAAPDARETDERTANDARRAGGPAATEAASGGRDAGASADDSPDTGLSDAWKGRFASSLHSLSRPSEGGTRADATLAAEFSPVTAPDVVVAARGAVAAASPGEADGAALRGPAERAFVRAYFDGSGARP